MLSPMPGLIAIVGRPNVGKSALFNRIVGRRIAIVHDRPGVTRDRVAAEAEWRGQRFTLVDTGGIGLVKGEQTEDVITRAAIDQVNIAIESACALLFVVDAKEGLVPLDLEVASRLRACGKPVLLVANKIDESGRDPHAGEFHELGFGEVHPVSALHNRGISPLMQLAVKHLPAPTDSAAPHTPKEPQLKLAIVGRPNVGKSSLINALTKSDRVVVSPIPGTTRDSVDIPFEVETDGTRQRYLLIDTAGMRKRRRIDDSVEFFSVKRSEESIRRSDLVVFVLDAETGILEQDKKIADIIMDAEKACVVVVNKWDLFESAVQEAQTEARRKAKVDKQQKFGNRPRVTLSDFADWVQEILFFLDYAPVIFTSAQSGFHLDRMLESVRYVAGQLQLQIPTAIVNRSLQEAISRKPPASQRGLHLKLFYATQTDKAPPTFRLFVNHPQLITDQYKKYLAGQLRKAFGYEGCPIRLEPKGRPRKVEPIRGGRKPQPTKPKRRPIRRDKR
jgi:GTP-binding protein